MQDDSFSQYTTAKTPETRNPGKHPFKGAAGMSGKRRGVRRPNPARGTAASLRSGLHGHGPS
ncbi:MAG: hypothetical protein AMXMBFR83_19710 [Phycisphaerae bacterium]